jgi:hypothetical protein
MLDVSLDGSNTNAESKGKMTFEQLLETEVGLQEFITW